MLFTTAINRQGDTQTLTIYRILRDLSASDLILVREAIGPGGEENRQIRGEDGSVDKGACCQAWPALVQYLETHSRRRKLTPAGCPLTSICTRWKHLPTHIKNEYQNKFLIKRKWYFI